MTAEHTCGGGGRSGCELCKRLEGELWGVINRYATTVGGDPSEHVHGNVSRMQAVVDVGAAIDRLVEQRVEQHVRGHGEASRPLPTNPDCTGTVGKDFVACGEEGYYCSDRCWTIGRLGNLRSQVAEYERQLGVSAARSQGSVTPGAAPEDSGYLLLSAADLPREVEAGYVNYCIDKGEVFFLEIDQERCQEALAGLAQLTGAMAHAQLRRSHPVLVVVPSGFALDRATRDQIIRAGGMPIFAPKNYSRQASMAERLRVLVEYLGQLRTAATGDGFRRMSDPPGQEGSGS